jgi:hypothetical protein
MANISDNGDLTLNSRDLSAGIIGAHPTFIDNLDGTFDIGACEVLLYDNSTHNGYLRKYSISAVAGAGTTIDATNYLVVDYNAGSPQYQITTNVSLINESDVIPVVTLYNDTNLDLHPIEWDALGQGLSNKLHTRIVKTARFGWESGLALGESATRIVTISTGVMWVGAVKSTVSAFDSSTGIWIFWYKLAGVWTKNETTTQYNNTQYQGATDLVALTTNNYGVNWVFVDVDGDAGYVLGDDSYATLSEANAAQPPGDLPPEFLPNGFLVGKIVVLKNATVATQIDSAFTHTFVGTRSTSHNNMSGLQGGIVDEYYHMTNTNHTNLVGDLWTDIPFSLTSANTPGADATYTAIGGGNYGYCWRLPASGDPTLTFEVQLPHTYKAGSDLKPHFHWFVDAVATDQFVMILRYTIWNVGVAPVSGTLTATVPFTSVAYQEVITGFGTISGTGIVESTIISCEVARLATSDANDTYADIIYLLSSDFHIQLDKRGSTTEIPV